MVTAPNQHRKTEADTLYEQYGKPLEDQHRGQYVAITKDGKVVLAPTLLEVMQQAKTSLGPGSFIFKIGEQTVGKWR
jgi:hypothetical protein